MITTQQLLTTAPVGGVIGDTATVTGLSNPSSSDTVTFNLYSSATVQNSSTLLFSDTETVTLNGGTATASSSGYPPQALGTDYWVATFNGDANNAALSSQPAGEPVTVTAASPSLSTTPGGTVILGSGAHLTDDGTLSGAFNPGGTITFYLFAPGVTPNSTDSNSLYTDVVTISGNGTYTTSTGNNPGGFLPTVGGTYQWLANYSGDTNNNSFTSRFSSEPESATTSTSTVPEPSVMVLFATVLVAVGFVARRRRRGLV